MFWSLGYLALRCLLQLVLLRQRSEGFKELEIVVLRHELAVLRRQTGRPQLRPSDHTVREVFGAGGNPYGTSYTSGNTVTGPDESALAVARYQGQRFARYAAVVAAAREAGAFQVTRPRPERFHAAALG